MKQILFLFNNLNIKIELNKYFLVLLILSTSTINSIAQITTHTTNLQHNFITENNNDFIPYVNNKKVIFWTKQNGLKIYFHENGMSFKQQRITEGDLKKEKHEKRALNFTNWSINFENGDSEKIIPQGLLSHYNMTYKKDETKITNIKNLNYENLLYVNVWPNIDIKFYLKDNESGLKYDIILKPGADSKFVNFSYDNATIGTNEKGNLVIETTLGDFTDQAPKSLNICKNKPVFSQFNILNNTQLGITLGSYDTNDTIVIDPWIVSPISYGDWAKEIDYDLDGNSYAILADGYVGPDINFGPTILRFDIDYEVVKYNTLGMLEWSMLFYGPWPGDITVSKTTGEIYTSVYIAGAYWSATPNDVIYRIDNTGSVMNIYEYNSSTDNDEFIRLKYDDCNNDLIVGAGGTNMWNPYNIGTVNTTLTSYNTFHVCGSGGLSTQDVCNMALDPDGTSAYFFVGESAYYNHDPTCNQNIFKVPLNGLTPVTWSTSTSYSFTENANNNGMACGTNYLYTYDGDSLFQWDKSNGVHINTISTGGQKYVSGGLDIESCSGNVYVGAENSIKVYDENLTYISSYSLPSKCTDLAINQMGKLFVSGKDFVSEINIENTFTVSSIKDNCNLCIGSATIEGCFSNTATFLWSPSGQTTQTAINLCEGWHKITITDNGTCNNYSNFSLVDSVYIDNTSLINCDEKLESLLQIPNTFTPNNDNNNDLFKITINGNTIKKGGDLTIFNRWGNKVFQSTDKMQWDGGKHNSGVYYYIFIYNNKDYKGNITLFK